MARTEQETAELLKERLKHSSQEWLNERHNYRDEFAPDPGKEAVAAALSLLSSALGDARIEFAIGGVFMGGSFNVERYEIAVFTERLVTHTRFEPTDQRGTGVRVFRRSSIKSVEVTGAGHYSRVGGGPQYKAHYDGGLSLDFPPLAGSPSREGPEQFKALLAALRGDLENYVG